MFINSMIEISKYSFENEQFVESIQTALEILKYDPCNEETYRIAMQAHAANGNRNEIDNLYKLCEKHLYEDLEAPPSPKTRQLYKTLMRI
jgi:DNA-binding SARP family transcriptional activator